MSPVEIISDSVEDTRLLGRRLGEYALAGDVVCLIGELGAGKTQLTQAVAEGLNIPAHLVTSPTYSLIAEHFEGRIPLYHMDAYRLLSEDELGPIGFDEYLSRGDGILVIEWADRIPAALPLDRLDIVIEPVNGTNNRRLFARPFGQRATLLAAQAFQSI